MGDEMQKKWPHELQAMDRQVQSIMDQVLGLDAAGHEMFHERYSDEFCLTCGVRTGRGLCSRCSPDPVED